MPNGTMLQLAASVGQIDTSDNLEILDSYGKAVILNGANKKIVDFVNTKIVTVNVGANPPDFGTLLTGGASGAVMVVDYITSLSGACTVYGNRRTIAQFAAGETVTGIDDDLNAVSFTLAVNGITPGSGIPPWWYDFTPFGNDATFGTLPVKLYLGAMFLGRLYVAGDPSAPYSWGASRQGNIWDWLYNADDVQSPVTGGDVEMGELQDIVRALIPHHDDYLLFGCANKLYMLMGDPMQGGSLKEVCGGQGIFGPRSYCFDEQGTLFYYGVGGIYRMQRSSYGQFVVENMTEMRLPRIIHDEAADSTTHRITMAYDLKRHGIMLNITNLATGTNSCYWWEKRTDGFYPEVYPGECSPFSVLYYNSEVTAQKDLLVGSRDGYIRRPSDTAKDDDIGNSDQAVDSYITFGPFPCGERLGDDGIISNIYGIMGETESVTSSSVQYYIYVGDSPEAVMKAVSANAYAVTGTVYAPGYGRGKKQRRHARGKYAAVRLRNNTAGQTWAFEEIEVDIEPAGRLA